MNAIRTAAACAFVLAGLALTSCHTTPHQPTIVEQAIWTPDAESEGEPFNVSPDNRYIASMARRSPKTAFLLNGKEISVDDEIFNYVDQLSLPGSAVMVLSSNTVAAFSEEGGHYGFVVRDEASQAAV